MTLPQHIAIIMDGNGRWAQKNILPRSLGHSKGAQVAEKTALYCKNLGIKYLTLYAFSSENWQRSKDEVANLIELFRSYLNNSSQKLIDKGVKLKFIGRTTQLDEKLVSRMRHLENISKNNHFTLIIAFNYSGREEIKDYISIVYDLIKQGNLNNRQMAAQYFAEMISADFPDPDLFIRTGGEVRISNFMLWHLAYTELCFINKLWPDFTIHDMHAAIKDFQQRDRRFGK